MSSVSTSLAATDADLECTSCGSSMRVFYSLNSVPVNSCILVNDVTEARDFPRGDIHLAFCDACGFIRNVAFDAKLTEYSGRYEETQGYSETFNSFHRGLVEELIERHDVRNKHCVEIGCGKGEFLALICQIGSNSGIGYDPSYDAARGILGGDIDARVVRDFYGPEYGKNDADLVVCKMTLEHIERCSDFVGAARLALKNEPDALAFFQVPESLRIFRECAFEDIYYEHCSYFTPGSAARLFRSVGFDVLDIDVTYAGQYLTIEAANGAAGSSVPLGNEDAVEELAQLVEDFPVRCGARIQRWRDLVSDRATEGSVVIWGSGSKGVSFLHTLEQPEAVHAAVDINPNRQSNFMLGTGQPIIGPEELRKIRPRTIIAMNSIYRSEIAVELEKLGIETELLTL